MAEGLTQRVGKTTTRGGSLSHGQEVMGRARMLRALGANWVNSTADDMRGPRAMVNPEGESHG